MGIQQMVSGLAQNIRKNNTTNARLGRDVLRRATSIAADLERSEKVEDKTKLSRVTAILEQTSEQFKVDPNNDDVEQRLDVESHYNRKIALIAADAELDKIQPPPSNRNETLRLAAEKDNEGYRTELKAICDGAQGSIRQLLQILPTKNALQDRRIREKLKEIMDQDDSFKELWELSSSVWEAMGNMVETGVIDKEIIVHITNLDRPDERTITQRVLPHQTLAELSETAFKDDDPDEPYPDYFVRKSDTEKNQCTKSGYYWQHQAPDIRVCDALTEDEHKIRRLDIVKRDGQYIIALVNDNGNENGKALDLPQGRREQKPVSESVKNFFTGRNIIKITSLDGKDIAEKPWSKRTFMPCSNPLYIELGEQTRRDDQLKQTVRVHTA